MTDSLAERAILEVVRRCGLILTASGYNTNIGTNVLRARRTVDITNSSPNAVVVWDGGETIASPASGSSASFLVDLTVNVEVHTKADQSNTGILIEAMKADVKRAVLLELNGALKDSTGNIGTIAFAGAVPTPREDGAATESMSIAFLCKINEAYGNPNSDQQLNIN